MFHKSLIAIEDKDFLKNFFINYLIFICDNYILEQVNKVFLDIMTISFVKSFIYKLPGGRYMKKLFLLIALIFVFNSSYPQAYTDSWSLGFGFLYPRYMSAEINGNEGNYGGFLSLQRNFSEHVGMRLQGFYLDIRGKYDMMRPGAATNYSQISTLMGANFDLIYNFVPCEPISPYLGVGVGGYTMNVKYGWNVPNNTNYQDYQINLLFGANWGISENWKIKTELGYHQVSNNKIDGAYGFVPSPFGSTIPMTPDAYGSFEVGFIWMFDKGEASPICDLYTGITAKIPQDALIDYNKIEKIVEKYSHKPVDIDYKKIEDIVAKYSQKEVTLKDKWVLIGVNFEFGKATLMPESFPILVDAARTLMNNPTVKVEIQGHTDNVGSEGFNKKLSLQRAETVKRFLVAKGVEASRLTTSGMGESQPVSDNKTPEGRMLNRRIEFKILSK